MTDVAQVRGLLDALEEVQHRLAKIVARTDPGRAHDLVPARRELADRMHAVITAGDALLAGQGDDEMKREFRQRFATMRAAVSSLHTKWSAIKVRDEGGAAYLEEVAAVRASDQACIAWTRTMLDEIEARQRRARRP